MRKRTVAERALAPTRQIHLSPTERRESPKYYSELQIDLRAIEREDPNKDGFGTITSHIVTKMRSLLPIVFLLISAFYGVPSLTPQARAASVGLVCIANQSLNPADCPSTPADLVGAVGSIVTVAINVQGRNTLNGFDISVGVDPSVLQPVSISLADSLIQEPRFVIRQSVNSTSGIVQVAMVALGHVVPSPATGNLFEISYNVLSPDSGTAVMFQLGCFGTSVPGVCVALADPNLVPATVETASFGLVPPNFYMSGISKAGGPSNSLAVQAGFIGSSMLVLESFGQFSDTVNLSIALVSPCIDETCPSLSLNSTSVNLSSDGISWTTLSFSAPAEKFGAPVTHWGVNVTGISGGLSHSVVLALTVLPPDFSLSWFGENVAWSGSTVAVTILLSSIGGFGTVSLTLIPLHPDCSASNCPSSSWSLGSTNLTLAPGRTAQTNLTFSAPYPPDGLSWMSYYTNVGATSGSMFHSTVVYFTIAPRNFTVSINPAIVTMTRDQSNSARVIVSSWFEASVSVAIDPSFKKGPSVELFVCQQHCYSGPFLVVSTNNTTRPGMYTVTVTVCNPWFTHTATSTLIIVANDHPKGD